MEKRGTMRKLFQAFAFGIFLFQMQNSLMKYISRPIVQLTSKTVLSNIDKPIIYLCQNGQFHNIKSQRYGYDYLTDFIGGTLNDNTKSFTWKGKDGSTTFQDLAEVLFDYNYTDIDVGEYYDSEWIEYDLEMEFMAGYGFCLNTKLLSPNTSHIYLASTQSITFFLVDPAKQNKIQIFIEGNAKGLFRQGSDKSYDYPTYGMDITLHNSQIYEGTKCTNYEKTGNSYGECIENVMKAELIKLYGCLPPWYLNHTRPICEQDKEIEISNKKKAIELTYLLASGLDLEVLNTCLKPCITMELQLRELHFEYLGKSQFCSFVSVLSAMLLCIWV